MDDAAALDPSREADAAPSTRNDAPVALAIDAPIASDAQAVWNELDRLGLTRYIAEIEVKGYTVIPPEKVAGVAFAEKIRNAILNVAERRSGVRPVLTESSVVRPGGEGQGDAFDAVGLELYYLLFEDEIFQQAVQNETALAITDYVLGKSAIVTACLALIKPPGGTDLSLHTDNAITPSPYSVHPQFVNLTWVLTDYTKENGAVCFVPGSHKFARQPALGEGLRDRVHVDAPVGSMIIWLGSTWHGAFARQAPGLRATLVVQMCRPHIRALENYRDHVPANLRDRASPRLKTLMGLNIPHGWREEGPTHANSAYGIGRHAYD